MQGQVFYYGEYLRIARPTFDTNNNSGLAPKCAMRGVLRAERHLLPWHSFWLSLPT